MKSKAGRSKNQRAVQKARPGQSTYNRAFKNQTVTEVNPMKESNFGKKIVNKARKWVTSAVLAMMVANSPSPVL